MTNRPGGLTVLAKFHQKWPVSHCASVFETLARRCFSTSGSALGKLKAVVKYITSDAMYDERFLEGALQENFPGHLFGYIPGTASGAKVALTATSGGNERSIFTNYNGSAQPTGMYNLEILLYLPNGFQGIQWFDLKTMRTKLRYGKRKLTSNHTSYTIVLNLNRARATTAAPMYVHTSISIYCFSRLIISLVSSSLLRLTVKSIGMVGLGSPTRLN